MVKTINNKIRRIRVLDVPVDFVNMSLALRYVEELVNNNKKGNYILAVNAEKFMQLRKDLSLKKIFEKASVLLPDGVGAVWALRWRYRLITERVPSVDLMQNICKESAKKDYRIFIYGAKENANKKAVEKLRDLYPGINIVGRSNGYVSKEAMQGLIDKINRSDADILFVALGSPKQEMWIQEYLPKVNVKVCQAIGGTLDAITGETKRAPTLFQKLPLEWLYRLIIDPKRIRRQAIIPYFLFKVFTQKRGIYPSTDYTDFHRLK